MKYRIILLISFIIAGSFTTLSAETKGRVSKLKSINTANAYTPKAIGLFIGIQEFEDPMWHNLKFPEKDVADMAGFFEGNKAISLDYKMILTEPETTSRDYILNHALESFGMKNSSEEDIVIVFFSGHGTLAKEQVFVIENGESIQMPRKRPYIVTSDTQQDKVTDSAIPLHKVMDWFDRLKSRRKVMILDMCHSGLGKSQISPEQARQINSAKGISFTPMEDSWASIILSACPMGGTSYEDENLSNSVYTHFLIKGMNDGDLNNDGAVTISEAHNYAIDKTRQYTYENKGYKQVPTAYSRILGKDPIIVNGTPAKTGNPVLFSYASANQGVEVFVDKKYKGMLPKGMKVDPGVHNIECRIDGQVIYKGRIEFDSGFEYMLPHFSKTKPESTTTVLLESGYRHYFRSGVPKDLIKDSATGGFSIYHSGIKKEWVTLSGGIDYSHDSLVDQYAIRAGLKYTLSKGKLRYYIGPDLMYLNYKYASSEIAGSNVDREMSFFCPGAEALLSWQPFKGSNILTGVRSYYVPYELNSESKNMFSVQGVLSIGYWF